jgi:hypothetical protein
MITRLGNGLVLGFLFTASFAWAGQPSAVSTDEGQQITIGVYDYVQAGLGILLRTERVVDVIFKNAGVTLAWLTCSADKTAPEDPGCADLSGPLKFAVRIEPNFMATKLRQKSDVFGLAAGIEEGEFPCDVWVFYDQVKELAVDKRLFLSQILGSVIAHELGHLLLGNSHSRSGLMRAVWSREELLAANLGELHLSKSERTRIQDSVSARHQAQGLAQAQQPLKVDGASKSKSNHVSDDGIPIELTSRFSLVLVRLEVNGRPATLVVDTGSSHTILSTQFLQLRGLALGADPSPSKGSGFVGRAAWIKASVHIGDEVLRDHEFLAMEDLPDISNAVGQKIDGIMGEDILKEFAVVEIDFRHRRLILLR